MMTKTTENKTNEIVATEETKEERKTIGQRFVDKVMEECKGSMDSLELPESQKTLVQGFFIGCDRALKLAEKDRIKKNERNKDHKYDNDVPYFWKNVLIDENLARDLVSCAKLGLDMSVPNMLSPILFKDGNTNMYGFTFMIGYRGRELVAMNYAIEKPIDVIIQLVYSNDKFNPLMKDKNNKEDSYEFTIANPFDRGEFVGAFSYEIYNEKDNRLFFLSKAAIEKRKPKYASAMFWGGTKTGWVNGKQEEQVTEGWYDEMAYKTMANYVYKRITISPKKIDDNYRSLLIAEDRTAEKSLSAEIEENANNEFIDVQTSEPTKQIENNAVPAAEAPKVTIETEQLFAEEKVKTSKAGF